MNNEENEIKMEIEWDLYESFPGVMYMLNIKTTGEQHVFSNEKKLVDYIKLNELKEEDYEAFTELMTNPPSEPRPLKIDWNLWNKLIK